MRGCMAEAGKRQTLFNLVRMRYGEPPAFLAIRQVVSGYTMQGTLQAGVNAYPSANSSTFGALLGTAQYTDRPTFTLNPVTGEQFVEAYLRPFAPADVLPLIQGGIPVDLLFRLIAQSIGPIQNIHPLGGPNRSGSPEFLQLLSWLSQLQEGGALRVRLHRHKEQNLRLHRARHQPGAGAARHFGAGSSNCSAWTLRCGRWRSSTARPRRGSAPGRSRSSPARC